MGQNDPNSKNTGKKKLRIMIFKKSNFRFVLNASLNINNAITIVFHMNWGKEIVRALRKLK